MPRTWKYLFFDSILIYHKLKCFPFNYISRQGYNSIYYSKAISAWPEHSPNFSDSLSDNRYHGSWGYLTIVFRLISAFHLLVPLGTTLPVKYISNKADFLKKQNSVVFYEVIIFTWKKKNWVLFTRKNGGGYILKLLVYMLNLLDFYSYSLCKPSAIFDIRIVCCITACSITVVHYFFCDHNRKKITASQWIVSDNFQNQWKQNYSSCTYFSFSKSVFKNWFREQ